MEHKDKKIKELESKLNEALNLLSEAKDLMGNTHCYDYEIYYDIGKFLEKNR